MIACHSGRDGQLTIMEWTNLVGGLLVCLVDGLGLPALDTLLEYARDHEMGSQHPFVLPPEEEVYYQGPAYQRAPMHPHLLHQVWDMVHWKVLLHLVGALDQCGAGATIQDEVWMMDPDQGAVQLRVSLARGLCTGHCRSSMGTACPPAALTPPSDEKPVMWQGLLLKNLKGPPPECLALVW